MSEIRELEKFILNASSDEFVTWATSQVILLQETLCPMCKNIMKMEYNKSFVEESLYRRYYKDCVSCHKKKSILYNTLIKAFGGSFRKLLVCILRLAGRQPLHSISTAVGIALPTLRKLRKAFYTRMKVENESARKLGGIEK